MTAGHRLEDHVISAEQEVSGFARAVALRRATITAAAAAALMFLVAMHWITPGLSDHLNGLLEDGLGFTATVGAGAWIHRGTTPARQSLKPTNTAGQRLVPDPSAGDAFDDHVGSDEIGAAFDDVVAASLAVGVSVGPPEQGGGFQ